MWPMLLNMTRDDCRRTLRRLELEAYSNMISVFRAQGPLEENRKKLLEELRGVLHISNDRHSAEARRVANDELLATIAEQLIGPNTGQGWVSEGRRRIPLMPRGLPQTEYTEIADRAAKVAAAENKEILKKLETAKLIAPKTSEEEIPDAEGETAESTLQTDDNMDELLYPPIVTEDQTSKLWETELLSRKRKIPEGGVIPDDSAVTPIKNFRNIPVNSNQKHLNLSQIYSKFSQPATSKSSSQSKHSYNQVSKVSTSKSNQISHAPDRRSGQTKHRQHKQSSKNAAQIVISKSQMKKSQDLPVSPSKQYNAASQMEYSSSPGSFQASYAQSLLGTKHKPDYMDEMKSKILSPPSMMNDSPTMQLLTQPATVPHELGVSDGAHADDPTSLQAKATHTPKQINSKPCHLIIKKKGDISTDKKLQVSDIKILQKPSESIKVLSNRQVVVAPSSTQKVLNASGKLVTTKVLGSVPKSQSAPTIISDKMIVVPKPEHKTLGNSKIIITSTNVTAPCKDPPSVTASNISPISSEAIVAKGIPATDLKVSAKTFLLNPKSGQKMVVLPGKPKTKTTADGQTVPLLHFKGMPTTMKLVPVSSQSGQVVRQSPVTVVSKPTIVSATPASSPKIVGIEPIKTANMADIVPVKGLTPISSTAKATNAIVRPTTGKGSVIVVQKGTTIGKALSFAKNGNDVSKIIMGKNVSQLLQASNVHKQEQIDGVKGSGNVIVLELNNDQAGRATTMSEILEGSLTGHVNEGEEKICHSHEEITEDTPVLFESQISEEQTCNTNSLDSTTASIGDIVPIEETEIPIEKENECKSNFNKDSECTKDTSSSVTDWEMELETVSRKEKDDDDKLNSLHLDLGMSSDSDTEYMVDSHKTKRKHSPQESIQRAIPTVENNEMYGGPAGLTQLGRMLLTQLQDEGSSSNDSSFALNKTKGEKLKDGKSEIVVDKSECDALNKAKEKLSEKVAEAKSQQKRIDIFSTAISSSDITLDSFSYLEEGMLVGDEMFAQESEGKSTRDTTKEHTNLEIHLSQLLDVNTAAAGTQSVSESLPLNKQ